MNVRSKEKVMYTERTCQWQVMVQPAKGADLQPLPYVAGLGTYPIPHGPGNGDMDPLCILWGCCIENQEKDEKVTPERYFERDNFNEKKLPGKPCLVFIYYIV